MKFLVIDAETQDKINDFGNGSILSKDDLGLFTIQAVVRDGTAGSVVFDINGVEIVDNQFPFTLDSGSALSALALANGSYTVTATAYSGPDGSGTVIDRSTVSFEIVGGGATGEGGGGTDGGSGVALEKSEFNVEAEAEAEAETEAEAEVQIDMAGAATANSATASAFGSNAVASTFVSGSVSMDLFGVEDRATETAFVADPGPTGEGTLAFSTVDEPVNPAIDIALVSAEAEAESEVEAEAETEVGAGSAAASAGLSAAAVATGADVFYNSDGSTGVVAQETATAINAATSTATSVGGVIGEQATTPVATDETDEGVVATPGSTQTVTEENAGPDGETLEAGVIATAAQQVDTEAEIEVESEAEAEAEVAAGAAAAAASGGSAVAGVGDFVSVDAETKIATSAIAETADLGDQAELSQLFAQGTGAIGSATTVVAADGAISGRVIVYDDVFSATDATDPPPSLVAPTVTDLNVIPGTGQYEAEAEAEAEAEVEAEVANNAAALAIVATGGGGANGLGATSLASASVSGSTHTTTQAGTLTLANDVVQSSTYRAPNDQATTDDLYLNRTTTGGNLDTAPAEVEAEAEATVELNLEGAPVMNITSTGEAYGPASSNSSVSLGGYLSDRTGVVSQGTQEVTGDRNLDDGAENRAREGTDGGDPFTALPDGNLEVENEAEAEVEVEAEIGFNSAAAGAAAVAVQAQNAIINNVSEAATATASSTSVFANAENFHTNIDSPGPEPMPARSDFPIPNIDIYEVLFEVEVETEVEAEVGYNAGAVAVAAGAAGYYGIKVETGHEVATNFAAGAAAAGMYTEIVILTPDIGEAGTVYASARAWDPLGRGVSVAVAVAGTPMIGGLDNEAELEAEGRFEVFVEVSVETTSYNPEMLGFLFDLATTSSLSDADAEPEGLDSRFESETEVEAEAEAEAGYGVAAAAAGAAAAGFAGVVSAISRTATDELNVDYGQTVVGTDEGDRLLSTGAIDLVQGGAGDDTINGSAGGDRLDGGLGNDLISGDDGADNLFGGAGNDSLFGGRGSDFISGGAGEDTVYQIRSSEAGVTLFKDTNGVIYLRDNDTGETDILVEVERIVLRDATIDTDEIGLFDGLSFIASNPALIERFEGKGYTAPELIAAAASIFAASDPGQYRAPTFDAQAFIDANTLPAELEGDPVAAAVYYIEEGASLNLDPGAPKTPDYDGGPIIVTSQPPQVATPIPDQEFTIGQDVNFAIPEGTFTDPDGGEVTILSIDGLPAGLTVSDGTIIGTPTGGEGTYLVTVTVADPDGDQATDTFKLVLGDGTPDLNPGGEVILDVAGGTASGATITLENVDDANGSIARFQVEGYLNGESIGFSTVSATVEEPGGDIVVSFDGARFDELRLRDDEGDLSAEVAGLSFEGFQVDGTATTTLPASLGTASSLTLNVGDVAEGAELSVSQLSDSNDAEINFTVQFLNGGVVVDEIGYQGTLATDTIVYSGGATFTQIKIKDPEGDQNIRVDAINYTLVGPDGPATANQGPANPNTAPVIAEAELVTNEDETLAIDAFDFISDAEGNVIPGSLTVASGPSNGSTVVDDGIVFYTPDADFFGVDTFTLQVTDGNGATGSREFQIDVNAVNDSPIVAGGLDGGTAGAGQNLSFEIPLNAFSDPDPDTQLSYSILSAPTGVSFEDTIITGRVSTPGVYDIVIQAEDEGGLTATDTFVLEIV